MESRFNHPHAQWDQLIVPMEESFDDYAKRLRDVVEELAAFESRPVIEVLNDLINVDADTLRYRVASPETGRGSIPLIEGIQLLEGAKRTILAAACSVLSPVAYHPRMSRTEAQQLLGAVIWGRPSVGATPCWSRVLCVPWNRTRSCFRALNHSPGGPCLP